MKRHTGDAVIWALPLLLCAVQAGAQPNLSGSYAIHDLFAQLNGEGRLAFGSRQFDTSAGTLTSVLESGEIPFLIEDFAVESAATFSVENSGDSGTAAPGGAFTVFGDRRLAAQDTRFGEGYASLQIGVRTGTGFGNQNFLGVYSYHGLISESNGDWRNLFGGVTADGEGVFLLSLSGFSGTFHQYTVRSSGRTQINNQSLSLATLTAGGALLVQLIDVNAGANPQIPLAHKGLALFVRRSTNATAGLFRGTYRVHELTVRADRVQVRGIGELIANGTGAYTGTVARNGMQQSLNGSIDVNATGTFRLNGAATVSGTMGLGGDLLVITPPDGRVQAGVGGTASFQIWLRTGGGDPEDMDSDGDGLDDSIDPDPDVRNDIMGLAPDELIFMKTVTDPAEPAPQDILIDSNNHPFFEWTATANRPWLNIAPASGMFDGTVAVSIDTTGLSPADSPFIGAVTVTAPVAMNSPQSVPVTLHLDYPPPELRVTPDALAFHAFEGGANPEDQTVTLDNLQPGPFAWTATTTTPWLSVSPESGQDGSEVTVGVNIASLTQRATPYTATVIFDTEDGANTPLTLPASLTVEASRELGQPFPIADDGRIQSGADVTHDLLADRYAVTWIANNDAHAAVLDGDAMDVRGGHRISNPNVGAAASVAVTANRADGFAWAAWENRAEPGASADILARPLTLEAGSSNGFTFGAVGGPGQQDMPALLENPDRGEIALAHAEQVSGEYRIRLAIFDGETRELLADTTAASADIPLTAPALALNPGGGEYLVLWTTMFDTGVTALDAQRLDAETLGPIGDPEVLALEMNADITGQTLYNAQTGEWAVLVTTVHLSEPAKQEAGYTVDLLRLDTNDLEVTGTTRAASGTGSTPAAHFALAPPAEQYIVLWSDAAELPAQILTRRVTQGGRHLGSPEFLAPANGPQRDPRTAYNPNANEFFAVWTDRRGIFDRIFAMRINAGTNDADGDGLPNDWEFDHGLDPFDPTGDNGADGDPDRDGLTNREEYELGTHPRLADTDGDGLLDSQEDRNRNGMVDPDETDPLNPDTDGDGFTDGAEWFLNSDPLDPASTPSSGIYLVEYGPCVPGEAMEVRVRVAAAEEDLFTLNLNAADGMGFNPPSGWPVQLNGDTTRVLEQGTHAFELTVTPPQAPFPAEALGEFVFQLVNNAGLDDSRTIVIACDNRETLSLEEMDHAELAHRFAPVLKLHRDEEFLPAPVELTLETAILLFGNGHVLPETPSPLDLFQSPQRESELDLPGITVEEMRVQYDALRDAFTPALYYTITTLGDLSHLEQDPPAPGGVLEATDIVIQYYIHFHGNYWGETTAGGNRHEGNWQVFQIILDQSLQPKSVTLSQQLHRARATGDPGGQTASWEDVQREGAGHPVVYVSHGSHGLYLQSGSRFHAPGREVHDGLGPWLLPERPGANPPESGIVTEYTPTVLYELEHLPRLAEPDAQRWLRYVGHWGQTNFPPGPADEPSASIGNGPRGPVFLGASDDPAEGVPSIWLDPAGWTLGADNRPVEAMTEVTGAVPEALHGQTLVLLDGRGRIYRAEIPADGGPFSIHVPIGVYTLAVVTPAEPGEETLLATARFDAGDRETSVFPTAQGLLTGLGNFSLDGSFLTGSPIYALTDTDGDGVPNDLDPDMDGDGIPNEDDGDPLGSGFLEVFIAQDPNGNGIPAYLDPANNGLGIPGRPGLTDTDSDGIPDVVDQDADNDGFSNEVERREATDPLRADDRPGFRLGDMNGDDVIDATDIQAIVNIALRAAPFDPRADLDGNGAVDATDIQRAVNRLLTRAVPE